MPAPAPVGLTVAHVIVAGAIDPVLDAVAARVVVRKVAPRLAVEVGVRDRLVGANDRVVAGDRARLQIGAAAPQVPDRNRPGTVAVGQGHRRVEAAGDLGGGGIVLLRDGQRLDGVRAGGPARRFGGLCRNTGPGEDQGEVDEAATQLRGSILPQIRLSLTIGRATCPTVRPFPTHLRGQWTSTGDGASIGSSQPHGGPGERTHRFVRWAVRHGRLLWLVAFALAVPSTVALVRLYKNLTSEVEELLPRNAPSVTAVEELRQRLPGLSTLGVVVATSSPSELPAAERLIDDLAARVRAYPPELVRAVKTGTEAAAERRFLAAHLPLFVDLDDLVEVRRRVEARRSWDTRNRLGIAFDEENAPPPLDFSDIEAKYQARYPGVRLPTQGDARGDARAEPVHGRAVGHDPSPDRRARVVAGRATRAASCWRACSTTSRRWAARRTTRPGCASASRATSRPRWRSCRRCRPISASPPSSSSSRCWW